MKKAVIEYPDELPSLLKLSEGQFIEEMRFLVAAKLYDMGKLSSGKAAQMTKLPRVEFLHRLGQYGFSAINLNDEQIDAELTAAMEIAQ